MDIGFVWDEHKYAKVQGEHQVAFWEVVSVFDDPKGLEQPDPSGHWERYMLVGRSASHRTLQVLYTEDYTEQGAMIYRLITAFDAGKEWTDEYTRQS
jgi:uncharacterized DUF497 family protein